MANASVHRIWRKYRDENLSKEEFRHLLMDADIFIPKDKIDDYEAGLRRQHDKADRILKRMKK